MGVPSGFTPGNWTRREGKGREGKELEACFRGYGCICKVLFITQFTTPPPAPSQTVPLRFHESFMAMYECLVGMMMGLCLSLRSERGLFRGGSGGRVWGGCSRGIVGVMEHVD